jgi:hypothetical protein
MALATIPEHELEHEHCEITEDDIRARKLENIDRQLNRLENLFTEQWDKYVEHKSIADSLMHDIELLRREQIALREKVVPNKPDFKPTGLGLIQAYEIYSHIVNYCLPNLERQKQWYQDVLSSIRGSY